LLNYYKNVPGTNTLVYFVYFVAVSVTKKKKFYTIVTSHTPPKSDNQVLLTSRTFRRLTEILGVMMSIVYGLEVGYKFYTLQVSGHHFID
jgi:hypothetical protein